MGLQLFLRGKGKIGKGKGRRNPDGKAGRKEETERLYLVD